MATWSPSTYLQFSGERSRPYGDLLARVAADAPRRVVDLGCGPGQLTATLGDRWPTARIEGIDSSPEMIEAACEHRSELVSFTLGDVADWRPSDPVDVIVCNATLQWVPDHRDLLPRLVGFLADGGWLAFQVPGNFDEPSHRLLTDLAAEPEFAAATAGVERPAAFGAAAYLADLAGLGCQVDAWETTYLHVLTGADPVFRWISGTGARPVLQALPNDSRERFVERYKTLLRDAYPPQQFGTVLPFRRVFVVAHKRAGEAEPSRVSDEQEAS